MSLAVWNYVAPRLSKLTPRKVEYAITQSSHLSVIHTVEDNDIDQDVAFDADPSFWRFEHTGGFQSMRISALPYRGQRGLQLTVSTRANDDIEASIKSHMREVDKYFGVDMLEEIEKAAVLCWIKNTRTLKLETTKRLLSVQKMLQEVAYAQLS